jgi:hypothetical protein
MYLQIAVDQAVKAVCPVYGISFGDPANNTTWRIDFMDEATDEQRAAAQQVVDNFTWSDADETNAAAVARIATLKQSPTMKAGYAMYKIANPTATFEDYVAYVDSIEL